MDDGEYPYSFRGWNGWTTVFADRIEIKTLIGTRVRTRGEFDRRQWIYNRYGSYWRLMHGSDRIGRGLNLPSYVGKNSLAGWVAALPEADRLEAEAMSQLIHQSDLFGLDGESRAANIGLWRGVAWGLAVLGGLLCGLALLWHWIMGAMQPQLWLAAAACPAVMGVVALASGGRLWVTRNDQTARSVMAGAMPLCVIALDFLVLAVQYRPLDPALVAGAALALAGAACGAVVAARAPHTESRRDVLLLGAMLGAAYGVGLLGPLDAALDLAPGRAEPFITAAVHVEHHSKGGDSYSADLVDPANDQRIEVQLSREQYEAAQGYAFPMLVRFHPGRMGAPWVEVVTGETPLQSNAWAWLN